MYIGIKTKLGAIFALLSILGFSLVISGVIRINQVTEQAHLVLAERIPLSRCAEEALLALTLGAGTINQALLIQDPEQINQIKRINGQFKETALVFEAFIRAMIWGSETEAFRQSSDGLTLAQWKQMGLDGTLIVTKAPHEIQQAAGEAHLYFGVFSKYVRKVIESQENILRLQLGGEKEAMAREQLQRDKYIEKANRYKYLVDETLQETVTGIYQHVGESNDYIKTSRDSAVRALISYSIVIFGFALIVGLFFARSISNPLIHLKKAAAEIADGKLETRVDVKSNDELGSLAETFNRMVVEVQRAYDDLEKKIRDRTSLLREEIVERQRVEADLRLMAKEVQKAHDSLEHEVKVRTEELESFVYALSHDLKTPVIALQGVASMFLQEYGAQIDDNGKRYIQRILSNTDYMADFIQGMLVLTRIGSQEKKRSEPAGVREILSEIIDRNKEILERKNIQVIIDPSLPHFALPPFHLTQLFQNLILNAAKFMGEQPSPRIEVGGREFKDKIEFYVKDNGIGIDPAYHKKIFSPFEQLKEVEAGGVGLGLAIITKIVSLTGGKVWVESKKGEGSTFFVHLPRQGQSAYPSV